MADFMAVTPQFRALAKLSMLAASVWAVIGGLLGAFRGAEIIGESPLAAALRFGAMYAMVGAISGIVTSLLVARAERKRSVGELQAGRMIAARLSSAGRGGYRARCTRASGSVRVPFKNGDFTPRSS